MAVLSVGLGVLVGLLMTGTREGVLPSYVPVAAAAASAFALCWRTDVRAVTLRVLAFSGGALAAEAIANSTPALGVEDPVLVNAILLVGIGDALAGLVVLIPIALAAEALSPPSRGATDPPKRRDVKAGPQWWNYKLFEKRLNRVSQLTHRRVRF